ncbi:hypothetical protein IC620_15540 [Hazenella sp. IB182357]|uniref:Uncharacterized protein n=1 Tax=Polycladospora coralii TaxID=2771432 RepID=A0A926NI98_9BACL|nr:hypothetical protein [Polycladospora coralii]MBD1373758.1 hypothetical protein [Polycladospora coralii]
MTGKPSVKAYVLKDGDVISSDYLDQYAIHKSQGGSKQINDPFSNAYDGQQGIVAPLYNPEQLAELMELNTYHLSQPRFTNSRSLTHVKKSLKPE